MQIISLKMNWELAENFNDLKIIQNSVALATKNYSQYYHLLKKKNCISFTYVEYRTTVNLSMISTVN